MIEAREEEDVQVRPGDRHSRKMCMSGVRRVATNRSRWIVSSLNAPAGVGEVKKYQDGFGFIPLSLGLHGCHYLMMKSHKVSWWKKSFSG